MDDFFVTLPSVASTDAFPSNTTTSFNVNLSKPLELNKSERKVALHSIILPSNIHEIERNIVVYEAEDIESFNRG